MALVNISSKKNMKLIRFIRPKMSQYLKRITQVNLRASQNKRKFKFLNFLFKPVMVSTKSHRIRKNKVRKKRLLLLSRMKRSKNAYFHYDIKPLINALKRKIKFQQLEKDHFTKSRVYFKYTGSNIFLTITNNFGEVAFVYSAGIFTGLRTRKEKTTIFVAQQLGELVSLRMYKTNAKEIFLILFINHTKARALVKFMGQGFKFIKVFRFSRVIFKRRIMRNGVRLAKPARK